MTTTTHGPEAVSHPTPGDTAAEAARADADRLSQEVARLTEENQRLRDDWEAHRRRMGRRARQVGREHDWCSVAQDLVEELGGIWPEDDDTFTFNVTATWRVRARLSSDADLLPEAITTAYLADSTRLEPVEMDDDWEAVEVLSDSLTVSDEWTRSAPE